MSYSSAFALPIGHSGECLSGPQCRQALSKALSASSTWSKEISFPLYFHLVKRSPFLCRLAYYMVF